jgi:DNA polymerase-3 subunit delta
MTLRQLNQELKRGKSLLCYYFYGDENFLIEEAIREIREKVVGSKLTGFNSSIYYGNEKSPEEIIKTAKTLPIMSKMRLVVIRDADGFSSKQLEEFLPYLQNPTPSTCLIFTAKTADIRKRFFQEIKKTGRIIQFKPLPEDKLAFWIHREVEKLSKTITHEALSCLVENGGGSLENIYNEIKKVALYIGEKSLIETKDLQDIMVDSATHSIFDLISYLGNKDCENGLKVLDKMLISGEHPLLILTMITRQFRLILQAKEILKRGGSKKEIKERLNIPSFSLNQLSEHTEHFSFDELTMSYQYLLDADLALKSSWINRQIILEKLIINLCKQNRETGIRLSIFI